MHDHLVLLLNKGNILLRNVGHFFRHFMRIASVGLPWVRAWPGIFSGKRVEGDETAGYTGNANHLEYSNPEQVVLSDSGERAESRREDPSRVSEIPGKIPDRLKNRNLIISIHIPKTGGTTFVEVLRNCADEVFYLDYGQGALAPTGLFHSGNPITAPFETIIDDLESFPGRSVIHGHFPVTKYLDRFPSALYVTWLRDPVERVASNYFYWQRTDIPGDTPWEQVTGQQMSLEHYAQLDFARDLQQAFLYPLPVEDFDFIGITEEYDRSLELFRRLFCPDVSFDVSVRHQNPNREGKFYDLDPKLRKKILNLNKLDAHTYLDGVRRFRHLCAQVGL